MVRKIVILIGRVQRVGFRDTVVAHASRFGVAGSVRNLRVSEALEIDVEGEAQEVERFIAAVLAAPPSWARIDEIVTRVDAPLGRNGFERAHSV
jgi:acylphosphatase